MSWPLTPLIALALDLLLKDPHGWPHPVRLLGRILIFLEGRARTVQAPLRAVGAVCVALVMISAWVLVWALTGLPVLGWLFALYFSYAGLALGALLQEGAQAAELLRSGKIHQARTVLAGLVSRDVTELDEAGLRRTLAETLSENLNDAFTAPFFYLLLLGPAGLWVYKAVSTMDSMWGYTTRQWKELGWAAARADDILAWIPARLAAAAILICAVFTPGTRIPAWSELARQASRTASPNAGWPMAAAALTLQAGMGGPTPYFGELKQKPWIGPRERPWDDNRIACLIRLVRNSGLLFALASALIYFVLMHHFA